MDCVLDDALPGVRVTAEVKVSGQTGVEMEALTAVSVACLTIYDMVKAADRGMRIEDIRLREKSGGRSGHYQAAMSLISVDDALAQVLATVGSACRGRTCLALSMPPGACSPKTSPRCRDQPPFPASAMDGYAVRARRCRASSRRRCG